MVIAIIAILAGLLLPALSLAKIKAQGLQCMSQTKQMTLAWVMYAQDNRDAVADSRTWVGGDVSYPGNPDYVDGNNLLQAGLLNSYLNGNTKVYQCPGDNRPPSLVIGKYKGMKCARSYSMNCYIGSTGGVSHWDTNYIGYQKTTDMVSPGPATIFVILDEGHTINDAFFATDMTSYDPCIWSAKYFPDAPATYHHNAGSFSFADGHSEIHKWRDPRTALVQYNNTSQPNNMDVDWIQSHASAKISHLTR